MSLQGVAESTKWFVGGTAWAVIEGGAAGVIVFSQSPHFSS